MLMDSDDVRFPKYRICVFAFKRRLAKVAD